MDTFGNNSPVDTSSPMKRCVVLGANGFIGSHVTGELLRAGHEVIACDIARDFTTLVDLPRNRLQTVTFDFLDGAATCQLVRDADWVFHLVSTTLPATSNRNMTFDVQSNIGGTIELLEACVAAGVSKLVFASSGGTVYGRPRKLPVSEDAEQEPIVSYGITKLAIERYCNLFTELYGLQTTCLRVANPFGPRQFGDIQGVVPVFLRRILAGEPVVIWGDGSVVRDYIYVDDVARAFRLAAEYSGEHRVFNIGRGVGVCLTELLEEIRSVVRRPFSVTLEPGRSFDVPRIYLDIARAEEHLGWRPQVGLQEGLERTWRSLCSS